MRFEKIIENVDLIDNYKKFRYFTRFLVNASATRYAYKYKDVYSGAEMTVNTLLYNCYPVFKKNEEEDGYTLYLFFPKSNLKEKHLYDRRENVQADFVRFLKEATKKDFKVVSASFPEGRERSIFEDANEYIEKVSNMRKLKEAEQLLEQQKKDKEKQEFIEKNKDRFAEKEDKEKLIIDPFGDGYINQPTQPQSQPSLQSASIPPKKVDNKPKIEEKITPQYEFDQPPMPEPMEYTGEITEDFAEEDQVEDDLSLAEFEDIPF